MCVLWGKGWYFASKNNSKLDHILKHRAYDTLWKSPAWTWTGLTKVLKKKINTTFILSFEIALFTYISLTQQILFEYPLGAGSAYMVQRDGRGGRHKEEKCQGRLLDLQVAFKPGHCLLGYPGDSAVKESTCKGGDHLQCERHWFNPWVGKIWRRKWQPIPIFLLGKPHGQRRLVSYGPWGCKESDVTYQLNHHHHHLLDEKSGFQSSDLGLQI